MDAYYFSVSTIIRLGLFLGYNRGSETINNDLKAFMTIKEFLGCVGVATVLIGAPMAMWIIKSGF